MGSDEIGYGKRLMVLIVNDDLLRFSELANLVAE